MRFCSLQHLPAKRRRCPKGRQPFKDHPVSTLPNQPEAQRRGLVSEPQPIGRPYGFQPTHLTIRSLSSIGQRQRAPAADLATVAWGDLRHSSAVAGFRLPGRENRSRRRSWDFPPFAVLLLPCGCRGVSARSRPLAVIRLRPSRSFFHRERAVVFSNQPQSLTADRGRCNPASGFFPRTQAVLRRRSAPARALAALGFSSCRLCGQFLYRTAPRACSNTSPRRQPWGACFHHLPIRS